MSFLSLGDASAERPRGTASLRRWTWILAAFFLAVATTSALLGEGLAALFALLVGATMATWLLVTARRAAEGAG